jgi:hypothetical protein
MKFFVEIDIEPTENNITELKEILKRISSRIELFSFAHKKTKFPLYDKNDNHIGYYGYENKEFLK